MPENDPGRTPVWPEANMSQVIQEPDKEFICFRKAAGIPEHGFGKAPGRPGPIEGLSKIGSGVIAVDSGSTQWVGPKLMRRRSTVDRGGFRGRNGVEPEWIGVGPGSAWRRPKPCLL